MIQPNRYRLDNGLRMVHVQNTSTAMCALTVTYDAGARDESADLTGLAHLFEHMMFGGSANVPSYDAELIAAGGESNAFTGTDFTTYYCVLPARNVEVAFRLESDRMMAPLLSDSTLEVQRAVVTEEYKQQFLNRPYADITSYLLPAVYGSRHPYAWPVIGKDASHIARITADDLCSWWKRLYSPSNAVLAVTGNISFDEAKRLTDKWFGDIPERPAVSRHVPDLPLPAVPQTVFAQGNVPATSVTVAFLMGDRQSPDYVCADALTDILGDGRASVFFRRFVMSPDSPFSTADASISGNEHQGMFLLSGRLRSEDIDPQQAASMLIDAAREACLTPVDDRTLQRLKNKRTTLHNTVYIDYAAMGQRLTMAEMHNAGPDDDLDAYLALTPAQLLDTAKHILVDTAPVILIYRPRT